MKAPRPKLKSIFIGVGIGLVLVAILGGIKGYQISLAIAESAKRKGPPPQAVTTVSVKKSEWKDVVESVGTLKVESGAMLKAEDSGRISKIYVTDGTKVTKGDFIIELDSEVEKAEYEGAVAQAELSEKSLKRKTKLFKAKAISQDDYDQALLNARALRKAADALKSRVDRRALTAPFSGTLGVRRVNIGDYVKEGDPLIPLEDLSNFYISFAVSAEDAAKIRVGDEVVFVSSSGKRLQGELQAMDPRMDPLTKTVTARASIKNVPESTISGAFGTVFVVLSQPRQVIVVPLTSIKHAPYGNSVFVVKEVKAEDGSSSKIAEPTFVKTGASRGDLITIEEGLTPGQEIVTSGSFKLQKGVQLIINNEVPVADNPLPQPKNS